MESIKVVAFKLKLEPNNKKIKVAFSDSFEIKSPVSVLSKIHLLLCPTLHIMKYLSESYWLNRPVSHRQTVPQSLEQCVKIKLPRQQLETAQHPSATSMKEENTTQLFFPGNTGIIVLWHNYKTCRENSLLYDRYQYPPPAVCFITSAITQFILQSCALYEHHHSSELQNMDNTHIFLFVSQCSQIDLRLLFAKAHPIRPWGLTVWRY